MCSCLATHVHEPHVYQENNECTIVHRYLLLRQQQQQKVHVVQRCRPQAVSFVGSKMSMGAMGRLDQFRKAKGMWKLDETSGSWESIGLGQP